MNAFNNMSDKTSIRDIVLICDDNYFMPTAVCVQSIIDNWSADNGILYVHICSFSLNSENIRSIETMGNDCVFVSATILCKEDYQNRFKLVSQKTHVSPAALIKFELPKIYNNINKILYLDSDIIIKSHFYELLSIDIDDTYLGASYELWNYIDQLEKKRFSLNYEINDDFYFNSGVMLLNLEKMRNDCITDLLWDYKINKSKTPRMDQESFNAICAGTAVHLPIKWNFNPAFCNNSYIADINKIYGTAYLNVTQLENDICIIHYVGTADKPWDYSSARMRSYWEREFLKIFPNEKLELRSIEPINKTYLASIKDRIKEYGVKGLICYLVNQILKRI